MPTVKTSTVDRTSTLRAALTKLQRTQVYVGIPEAKGARRGEEISNAQLMFIHTNGSPLRGIPPRPVIEPAIEALGNRERITAELGQAAQDQMAQKPESARRHLERAGQLGANASIRWFDDPRNHWAPNKPSTVQRKGSDQPLIDTGQLRRSIVYVVDEQ